MITHCLHLCMDSLARDTPPESGNSLLSRIMRCHSLPIFHLILTRPQNTKPAQINIDELYVESAVKIAGVFVRTETCSGFAMREND